MLQFDNNSYNTQYGERSAVINHRRAPMQKANSFSYGNYSSLAVNMNTVDSYSLPRRLSERPHSNPSLYDTRVQRQSPTLDAMGLQTPDGYFIHSSNPSIATQRSYSLRDDRTNRIHLPRRRHLETVYETEDTIPSSSSSGSAPLLVRQKRVTSPFPYSGLSFHDTPSSNYSPYPNSISPQLSMVTANSSSNISVHSPEHKIANYEYML